MASITGLVARYSGKANGVYREVIDETGTPRATSTTNVVVLIQSEQGPVMRPIYVEDADALHATFGTRNAKLEAKGCYGILMAEHVLETGPIWVLNIKNIAANEETLQVAKLACNGTDVEKLLNENIATVYDTTKFWKVDPLYGTYGEDAILSFASVLNGAVTVVVRKYNDTAYMYTIAETKQYNPQFLGEGLRDDDFVNDYLVQVDIFKANLLTANIKTKNAIVGGRVNVAVLDELREDVNAKHFKTYVGSIGNVIDRSGNNLSIVPYINADVNASGVWCSFNADAIAEHGIDLLGTEALVFDASGTELPTVKASTRLGESFTPTLQTKSVMFDASSGNIGYTTDADYKPGDVVANTKFYGRVSKVQYVGDTIDLNEQYVGTSTAPVMPDGKPFPVDTDNRPIYPANSPKANQLVEFEDVTPLWYYQAYNPVLQTWQFNDIEINENDEVALTIAVNGEDRVVTESALFEIAMAQALNELGIGTFAVTYDAATGTVTIEATAIAEGLASVSLKQLVNGEAISYVAETKVASNMLTSFSAIITVAADKQTVSTVIAGETVTNDVDFDAVKAIYGTKTQVRQLTFDRDMYIAPAGEPSYQTIVTDKATYTVVAQSIVKLNRWEDALLTAKAHVLVGIVSKDTHYVNGTVARQEQILNKLTSAGFIASFTDPTIFRCRYIIDSFKTYVAPNQKSQLATLADNAKRFIVLTPAPFYHELRSSKNPSFYDALGNFKMQYVAQGSNPDIPSTNSFGYTQSNGAEWLIPVMNVMYNSGYGDTKVVPATGLLGKYYYAKHFGAHKVYDIVAGQDWPLSAAGVTGPEFEASPDDRAAMQSTGTNVLQVIGGTLQLRSSLTAYQIVKSSLNSPETLEKVLFVADYTEPILNAKMFKYNNPTTRQECKQRADEACAQLLADGAISSYNNICDLSNNPLEVRKAGIIVLDTELYDEYGICIAVHRITIKNAEE